MRLAAPKMLRWALVGVLLIAVITGFIPLSTGSPLPLTDMLDVWLILLGFTCVTRGRIESPLVFGLVAAYTIACVVPAIITQAPLSEFLRAYRWLLYLLLMILAIGRSWGDRPNLVRLTWFLLIAASVKYALMTLVLDSARPVLFLENNFEIPLFFGLVILTYNQLGKRRVAAVGLAGLIALLSQSRSGILAFACLVVFAFFASPGRMKALRALLFGIPLGSAAVGYVFASRSAGEIQMDRARFFNVFKHNVADWDLATWMFGTTPLTPLSTGSCASLSFYQSLIYSPEYDTCYSVVLHSFGMRVVYDAGILGLVLAFGIPLFAMLKSGVSKKVAFALLAIAVTNALSVSSINNPYVALPIFLAILYAGTNRQLPDSGELQATLNQPVVPDVTKRRIAP